MMWKQCDNVNAVACSDEPTENHPIYLMQFFSIQCQWFSPIYEDIRIVVTVHKKTNINCRPVMGQKLHSTAWKSDALHAYPLQPHAACCQQPCETDSGALILFRGCSKPIRVGQVNDVIVIGSVMAELEHQVSTQRKRPPICPWKSW